MIQPNTVCSVCKIQPWSPVYIVHLCPLHAQAPAMREALKSMVARFGGAPIMSVLDSEALKTARAILRAIEGA